MAHDALCMRITEEIREYEGEARVLSPPLYEAIDTDALEQLLQSTDLRSEEGSCVVRFSYCDYTITVDSAGTVNVTPDESVAAPSRQPVQEITN